MKKGVLLVQVVDNYGPNKFLPLAISYQWLNAVSDKHIESSYKLVDVLIEKANINKYLDSIEIPDIVMMSCYVWNWNYNCALAKEIKARNPNSFIIIGGPQVSKTDLFLLNNNPYFDLGILGENEESLKQVLHKLTNDSDFSNIPGIMLSGKIDKRIERTVNLDRLPSPILSGFYDWIIDRYETKYNKKFMWQVTFETMRGCPYHCAFCDIGESYWNKAYMFDIDRVKKEIDWMAEKKIEYVSICDSNWGMFERDYEITEYVVKKKLETGYPNFWDVTWAKNNHERIKKMAVLDKDNNTKLFKGINFSLQTLTEQSLKVIDRFNFPEHILKESMEFYKKRDIPINSELIWPLPGETVETLTTTIQKLIDLGQKDFLMIHPLVLTPNSPMGQPEYIDKHQLKYNKVPLDTFWLKMDNPEDYITEDVYAVYGTSSATLADTIKGHLISHWIVVLFYYGWAHYVMKYAKNVLGISETDFVLDFMNYVEKYKPELLYSEHMGTTDRLKGVLVDGNFWGTLIDGVYWEYKSSTCVKFYKNKAKFKNELTDFLKIVYNIDNSSLLNLNFNMIFDWKNQYPITMNIEKDLQEKCLEIQADKIKIYHYDKSIENDTHFIHKAYHWQRKNRYWKCSVSKLEDLETS